MPTISIIVPVYNVEKYLRRCVDSILNQTFKDFELILVDDGSPDKCGEICNEYERIDKRIKVIHKENGGVSTARNTGLKAAKGEYVLFIDSDDWVECDLLEDAVKSIKQDNSDIVFWGFFYDDESEKNIKVKCNDKNIITSNIVNSSIELYKKDLFGYTWCKLFKAKIIKDNDIKFNEVMKYCEDEEFTCKYLKYSKRISIMNKCKYHYISYFEERTTLSQEKNREELLNRDTLFRAWQELLGEEFGGYLINKAYVNVRFVFYNVVWGNFSKHIKKEKVTEIIESDMLKYIFLNAKLPKHRIMSKCIMLNKIILFRFIHRLCGIINIEL